MVIRAWLGEDEKSKLGILREVCGSGECILGKRNVKFLYVVSRTLLAALAGSENPFRFGYSLHAFKGQHFARLFVLQFSRCFVVFCVLGGYEDTIVLCGQLRNFDSRYLREIKRAMGCGCRA